MSITREELLHDKKFDDLDAEQQENFNTLYERVVVFRNVVGIAMTVTNCIRTWAEHLAIYAKKGITDLKKIPKKSKHLFGCAADFADPRGALAKACTEAILEACNLWAENPKYTKGWLHLQCQPYPSWKPGMSRMYIP